MNVSEIKGSTNNLLELDWSGIDTEQVALVPIPITSQPNAYIRTKWADREYGLTRSAQLSLARSGNKILARLEWDKVDGNASEKEDGFDGEFTDAAAIFFPLDFVANGQGDQPEAPPLTIGTHQAPVRLWYWRDQLPIQRDLPPIKELYASGPGVFRPNLNESVRSNKDVATTDSLSVQALKSDNHWTVVISGEYEGANNIEKMGIAIWDGSNQERAGIGSVSPQWIGLEQTGRL